MQKLFAFGWGFLIATLGGLIGLGGAEFRLPILASFFKYPIRDAIVLNLVMSLVTVFFSLLFRTGLNNLYIVVMYLPIILNILVGSLLGSFLGVHLVTRISEHQLRQIIAGALVFLSFVLIAHDLILHGTPLDLPAPLRLVLGLVSGFVIGIFSSALGVAGGELIIPTITLLYAVDIKLAGTLSLAISIPTLIIGLWRYYSRQGLSQVRREFSLVGLMALGSIGGALCGSYLLQYVSPSLVSIALGGILLFSAFKLLREDRQDPSTPIAKELDA